MKNEEIIDWLCRLRSDISNGKERVIIYREELAMNKFREALTEAIDIVEKENRNDS